MPAFRLAYHKNQRTDKHVESRLVWRLDSGSSPLTSTDFTQMRKALFAAVALITIVSCSSSTGKQPLQINSDKDLAGHKVATIAGIIYDFLLSPRKDIELQLYNNDSDLIQALTDGHCEVIAGDETFINRTMRERLGIKIACLGEDHFPTALMFRKEDKALAEALNAVQERMIRDGSLDSLKRYWLQEEYLDTKEFTHLAPEESGEPLRVATATYLAPVSFLIGEEWYGMETDLVRELARYLHRKVEIQHCALTAGSMSLSTGKIDVMMGSLFITAERQRNFVFAEPYHYFRPAYYVKDYEANASQLGFFRKFASELKQNLIVENRWKYITEGLSITIEITLLSILLGAILGIGLCAMGMSRCKWLRSIAKLYGWFMAGIPMLVLLLIFFYVILGHSGLSAISIAIVAFGLNFASGAASVYTTALNTVPIGQSEAGLALGFTKFQTFNHIVLPQALKCGLPLFKSQCVSLLKGTSIVGYIAIHDLTRAVDVIRSRTFDAFVPLLVITVIYFVLVWLIGCIINLATPKKGVL